MSIHGNQALAEVFHMGSLLQSSENPWWGEHCHPFFTDGTLRQCQQLANTHTHTHTHSHTQRQSWDLNPGI